MKRIQILWPILALFFISLSYSKSDDLTMNNHYQKENDLESDRRIFLSSKKQDKKNGSGKKDQKEPSKATAVTNSTTNSTNSSISANSSGTSSNSTNTTKNSTNQSSLQNVTSNSTNSTSMNSATTTSSTSKTNTSNSTTQGKIYLNFTSYNPNSVSASISVGFNSKQFTVGADPNSPMLVLKASHSNNSNTSYYDNRDKIYSWYMDPYKYRDGSMQSIGHYFYDMVCYPSCNSNGICSSSCIYNQILFGAISNSSAFGQLQGFLGLAPGTPSYGKSLLSQFGYSWSYYTGMYKNNLTQLIVGTYQSSFLQANSSLNNHSCIHSDSWDIQISQFSYESLKYLQTFNSSQNNTNDIQYGKFDFTSDSLIIPNKTFKNLTAKFQSKVKGLVCNSTYSTSCYYNGICSEISGNFSSVYLQFGFSQTYEIPVKAYLIDDEDNSICRIMMKKSDNNYITLGTPFFKTFYTVYDSQNMVIGIGLSKGSLGSINTESQ